MSGHFFFFCEDEPELSRCLQTLKIPIQEISKLIIGKHDKIENSLSIQEPRLFLTIVANDHFHFLKKESAVIHGLMKKLSNHLLTINKQMNMQQDEIFDAILEIQNGTCQHIEIKIIPSSMTVSQDNMIAIALKKNHFFTYLKTGKLSKQAAPLIVNNEFVRYEIPEVVLNISIKQISKIIIGKHAQMPKSALSEQCHMLLTIDDNDERSYCFLKQNKSEFSIEQFLISLINESAKMKDFDEMFSLNEQQMSVFDMMKNYDGSDGDIDVHMVILPEKREESEEECLMDEDGKIGFADRQMEKVSMTIYDVMKRQLSESIDEEEEEEEDEELKEEIFVERTKSIGDLEKEFDELELFEQDELKMVGLSSSNNEENVDESCVFVKDVVTMNIDEEDKKQNVDLLLTKDFVQIGTIKMNYSRILVLIYCMDYKERWTMLTTYGNINIIASSEKARQKCISFMQNKQQHASIAVSFY